jgi:hypothetical protein
MNPLPFMDLHDFSVPRLVPNFPYFSARIVTGVSHEILYYPAWYHGIVSLYQQNPARTKAQNAKVGDAYRVVRTMASPLRSECTRHLFRPRTRRGCVREPKGWENSWEFAWMRTLTLRQTYGYVYGGVGARSIIFPRRRWGGVGLTGFGGLANLTPRHAREEYLSGRGGGVLRVKGTGGALKNRAFVYRLGHSRTASRNYPFRPNSRPAPVPA